MYKITFKNHTTKYDGFWIKENISAAKRTVSMLKKCGYKKITIDKF